MDEIREQMDLASEISEAISQPVGFGLDLDEVREGIGLVYMDQEELNNELEALEQEELDSKLLEVGAPSGLPSVPQKQKQPAVEIDEDEAELEELKASMAM